MFVPSRRDSSLSSSENFTRFAIGVQTPTAATTTTSAIMQASNGSVSSESSKMSAHDKKDRFANNYKVSHISQSTGNLNTKINLSLLSDLQFNDSQFYEIMYVGKIRVSQREVPKTFIDTAIQKFHEHNKLKLQNLEDVNEKENRTKVVRSDSIDGPKRNRAASISCIDQNRTMVLILGKQELRLISTDRKQVLLNKSLSDIINIVRGVENKEHFGIICTETKDNKCEYIGYVFKCQSDSITSDIIFSVNKYLETNKESVTCDHCPVIWYKRLESLTNGLDERRTHKMIMKFVDEMSDEDREIINEKYSGSDKVDELSQHERNKFLMALIEAHCQLRQRRHVHDTIENRSEFLQHYLGGSTIFLKARRSLAAFDHLLKRRGSSSLVDNNNNPSQTNVRMKPARSMSLDPTSTQSLTLKSKSYELQQINNTSKMEMFMKVGNKPNATNQEGSWRKEMLRKSDDDSSVKKIERRKRNSSELRALWKFAGRQIILLMRMERQNVLLQERQNEHEIRRLKLNYNEIVSCDFELVEVWEELMRSVTCHDQQKFLHAIRRGVPKQKRGEVWLFLAEKFTRSHPNPVDLNKFPHFHDSYSDLLTRLTEHQHAIFIDIGRTFPRHEYYKNAFGMGQLSLFNLLKAYSIIDPEMGYCQGLAFICGVLLLHLSEMEAFSLLKHLMFERQMRENFLPDMKQFQMQLYQVSRLIKDNIPEVHELFERNDVSTTLYASSWMLTIFSSCFELGFVARVYDLLFYASNEVIFRVVLSLLIAHKDELLQLDGFDEITEYLKKTIPQIDEEKMRKVFENIFTMNITRQLMDYKIEYNVLMEEIQNTQYHVENFKLAQCENKNLSKQLEVAESVVERLENIRHSQQQEILALQNQLQDQEVAVQTLTDFVTSLVAHHSNIEIPSDIKRLIRQIDYHQQQQTSNRRLKNGKTNGKSELNVVVEMNEIGQTSSSSDLDSPVKSSDKLNNRELQRNLSMPSLSNGKPELVRQDSSFECDSDDDSTINHKNGQHPLSFNENSEFTLKSIPLRTIRPTNSFRKK